MQFKVVVEKINHYSVIFQQNSYLVDFIFNGISLFLHVPLEYWSFDDYKRQWVKGFERIKDHDKSCILLQVDVDNQYFQVFGYFMYKKKSKVLIQRNRFYDNLSHISKDFVITPDNCYELIPEYKQYHPIFAGINRVCWELSDEQFDNLHIRITSKKVQEVAERDCIQGKISFDDFSESIDMPITDWSGDDYEKQWQEGIARLQKFDSSCLITRIADLMLERWLLYKQDGKIFIYFDYIIGVDYQDEIGDVVITLDNWYQFIPAEKEHLKKYKVDEWEFNITDFDDLEIEFIQNKK